MQTFVASRRHKASASTSGRFFANVAVAQSQPLAVNKEADDQRRKYKHVQNAMNAARPLLSSETFPSTFVPSVKVTVPVGVPTELSQSTSAMKVTGCP
jgi:hypothetical protein